MEKALGKVVNGVAVITAEADGKANGMTAAWFTRVSSVPPLVIVSVGHGRYTKDLIKRSQHFCVNILAENQVKLARKFGLTSGRNVNKFDGINYTRGKTGSPVLDCTAAYLDCRLDRMVEVGDHVLFIGEVVDCESSDRKPLVARMDDYL